MTATAGGSATAWRPLAMAHGTPHRSPTKCRCCYGLMVHRPRASLLPAEEPRYLGPALFTPPWFIGIFAANSPAAHTAVYAQLQRYGRGMGCGTLHRRPKTPQTPLLLCEAPSARSETFEHVSASADAALGDGVGIVASQGYTTSVAEIARGVGTRAYFAQVPSTARKSTSIADYRFKRYRGTTQLQ